MATIVPFDPNLSPDGGGFTNAAVHRLAADGYALAADGYDGQISEPDEYPQAEGLASRGSWRSKLPDLSTTKYTEHTEMNAYTGYALFPWFRCFLWFPDSFDLPDLAVSESFEFHSTKLGDYLILNVRMDGQMADDTYGFASMRGVPTGRRNCSASSHCMWSVLGSATHHGSPSRVTCWSPRMILQRRPVCPCFRVFRGPLVFMVPWFPRLSDFPLQERVTPSSISLFRHGCLA